MQYCCPVPDAENQISFPDGLHAKPASDSQSRRDRPRLPAASMTITSPRSSTFGGCLKYATLAPSGETRTSLIQFSPSHKTLPMGYCSRQPGPGLIDHGHLVSVGAPVHFRNVLHDFARSAAAHGRRCQRSLPGFMCEIMRVHQHGQLTLPRHRFHDCALQSCSYRFGIVFSQYVSVYRTAVQLRRIDQCFTIRCKARPNDFATMEMMPA